MLTFVVPVKSKRVASNWPKFCALFERTLISICNQTDDNFKVVVVCHEIPNVSYKHDHVHYIRVDFEPPIKTASDDEASLNKLREIDKGKKLQLGAKFAKENFNTDYVMTVDSDDLVSNRIAAYVNGSHKNIPGWYIKNGYIYLEGNFFLFVSYKFNYLCGSSVIVKPELLKYFFDVDPILYFDHRLTVLDKSIALEILPFNGGIYSMANGENHLMHRTNIKKFNNHKGWMSSDGLKRISAKIRNYGFKPITKKVKREFSFKV